MSVQCVSTLRAQLIWDLTLQFIFMTCELWSLGSKLLNATEFFSSNTWEGALLTGRKNRAHSKITGQGHGQGHDAIVCTRCGAVSREKGFLMSWTLFNLLLLMSKGCTCMNVSGLFPVCTTWAFTFLYTYLWRFGSWGSRVILWRVTHYLSVNQGKIPFQNKRICINAKAVNEDRTSHALSQEVKFSSVYSGAL